LDKETSGVIVFAKNEAAHKKASGLFARRCVEKTYIAIVHGKPAWREETCELPLLADGNKKHQTIVERFRGKPAVTKFSVVCMAGNYSALLARPLTGRTHQIRVSLARLRHPVVCDELYGTAKPLFLSEIKRSWRGDRYEERPLIQRLGLHALRLVFPDGQVFEAPPPKDMKATLRQFEKNGVVYEHDSMA
jgi:23S rRNA pseudouridine1911/1915/1917 synthase